jgi:pyruvate-formate lyase-activating enzyme
MGFVVNTLALEQVLLLVLGFTAVSIISPMLPIHFLNHHQRYVILATDITMRHTQEKVTKYAEKTNQYVAMMERPTILFI